ncbi:MAG: hypothetical protein OXC14_01715, partial [Rhodospirillaceae bacterium]|nr:hypothetical protein [Rhodospirillaceae bacterium]
MCGRELRDLEDRRHGRVDIGGGAVPQALEDRGTFQILDGVAPLGFAFPHPQRGGGGGELP